MRTWTEGVAVIKAMSAAKTNIGEGNCKLRTREAFGVPSSGAATAAKSWAAAPDQHKTSDPDDIPDNVFVWWTGGSTGAGHVAVLTADGLWTPGGPADDDHWTLTTLAALMKGWPKLTLAGWTYSIDGATPERPKETKTVPKPVPGKWGHFAHFEPYQLNNSTTGLRKAKRLGYPAIDLDFQVTANGVVVNTHWGTALEHGFRDPLGRIAKSKSVSDLTWAQVRRLRAGRFKIRTAQTMLRKAKRKGLRVEFEAKGSSAFEHADTWEKVAAIVNATGVNLQVKTLSNIPGAKRRLKAAKAAGLTTIILLRDDAKPADYAGVADYWR